MNMDFSSPTAANDRNNWANIHTEGLIPEIVQTIGSSTVAAIANVLYFSNRWKSECRLKNTKEDIFYSPTEESKAEFMFDEG